MFLAIKLMIIEFIGAATIHGRPVAVCTGLRLMCCGLAGLGIDVSIAIEKLIIKDLIIPGNALYRLVDLSDQNRNVPYFTKIEMSPS